MSWTIERTELLRALWAEGLSASQIAGRVPGKTRNAVIGKVHRLGLSGRATTSRSKPKPRRVADRPRKRILVPKARKSPWQQHLEALPADLPPPAIIEAPIPEAQRRTVETLEAHHCRWPIGEPQHADFHFCGATKLEGLPYCECHARRAFTQSSGVSRPDFIGYRSRITGALLKRMTNSVNLFEDA